ncbi:2-keto-4-pentenoate hydratase [Amycolatopsis cihanbeyliensis]|uniref:2-keto-4-pentenoate hydratase n=1 Tax=Amycolatopsis cihanbeyliensis TaxID=1128664 RepID=UPI001151098A|nr:fumarylacetoacetate hydrolase family protein [Amycolatopsis cihanbeyliensis]
MNSPNGSAARAAEQLWAAWRDGHLLDAVAAADRPADLAEGMAVQRAVEALAGPGYGWKIAATGPGGRAFLGVDGPLPGRLLERFQHENGDTVPADTLHMGVAEAEFAFVLGADLDPAAPHSVADVLAAVSAMHLVIELPDSRYERFDRVGGPQLIADAACAGRMVIGPEVPGWAEVDLVRHPVSLRVGSVTEQGSGELVLGDPREALHWLATELPRLGTHLRAGELVATGTATKPLPIRRGDEVVADFGELGTVGVHIAA